MRALTRGRPALPAALAFTAITCVAAALSAGEGNRPTQQPRDAATKSAAGSAVLGGVVTTQDESARPVRRVLVTLSGSALTGNPQVVTDDAGRFAFPELPAGRYTLTAEKPGYVKTYQGSRRIGRGPGMPLALAEGQRLTTLAIKILRGAAIEGTIVDENGVPVSSAQVGALQPVIINGERKLLSPPGSQWATSDDRGVYRLYGLPPGEYTVRSVGGGGVTSDTRLTTAATINAALQELQGRSTASAAPPSAADTPQIARSRAYFPGVTDATLAEFFTLAAGQERTGVDVRSPLVRATRLEGTAVGPSGQPLRNVMMGLADASTGSLWTSMGGIRPRGDGRFSVGSLTPGRYIFFGRGTEAETPANPGIPLPLWTSAEVLVNEQDFLDLVLQFLPGTSVSGRVVVSGGAQAAPDMSRIRITLSAVPAISGTALSPPPLSPHADGSFAFTGVPPGKYRIALTGDSRWSLRSAIVNGRDTLDQPLEVLPGQDLPDIAVVLTDRPTEISGTLFDQLGRPSPEYAIVIFSTDRAHWTAPRRTSGVVKLASDGRFTVTGLPPGEYFLTALVDPDPSQLGDLSFLEQLAAAAIRISVGEGEKKVQDLKISGGRGQ